MKYRPKRVMFFFPNFAFLNKPVAYSVNKIAPTTASEPVK